MHPALITRGIWSCGHAQNNALQFLLLTGRHLASCPARGSRHFVPAAQDGGVHALTSWRAAGAEQTTRCVGRGQLDRGGVLEGGRTGPKATLLLPGPCEAATLSPSPGGALSPCPSSHPIIAS